MALTTVRSTRLEAPWRRAGGLAALYLAVALLASIPYFLLVVDYPGAPTAADKVELVVDNYAGMYAVYVATYLVFGLALAVLALAVWEQLHAGAPVTMRIATAVGLLWAVALVASGMVFTYGMTTITDLAAVDRAQAVATWQAIEPVALALGGAGGELLGGLWVLLVSVVALRGGLTKVFGWLGVVIGVVGSVSVIPPLHDATVVFGLLQIPWLVWLAVVLVRTRQRPTAVGRASRAPERVGTS